MAGLVDLRLSARVRRSVRRLRAAWRQDRGATGLEFVLLLAAFVLPSVVLIRLALEALAQHYQMIVTLNAMPMP